MADTVRTRVYRPLWMDNEDENAGEEEGEDAGDSEDEGGNGRRVILTARSSESESPPSPWSVSMDNDNASDSEDEEDSYNVGFNPGFLTLSPEYKQAQHQAWLPFVPFLKKLPGLTDVVWACRDLVPACVLTALHEHHPTVRLHVRTFSLRSLYQEQNQLHDVDPDEYSLVTSPCLTSIRTSVQGYDDEGRFSFNVEALKHILQRGYAPNLRYLRIRYTSTSGTIALVEALRAPRGPWRGFFHDRPAQEPPADWKGAQLETLIINDNPGPWRFRSWMECIDPIFLRRFEYTWVLSLDGLQILVSLAESGQLRSLRQLVITLNVTDNNGRDLPNDHDDIRDRLAAQLFRCLPPLETLKLLGSDISAQTFEGLLERHGPTLRKLHLPFYDLVKQPDQDLDKVRSIQRHCPRLEDIHLGIRRRHGNAQEVAMYRTLGKLPRLRRANLILDCTVPSDKLTHNFNVKREERIAEVLYKLKNLAVDETLARAIYKEISSSGCAATLERLTLEPKVRHGRVIHGDGFSPWLDWVIRSWLITRNVVRDEEVVVREIKSHYIDWEARREELEEYRENEVETWRRLWPSKGGNWMDEWHSFPLDTEGADALVT
ncbi:hypothetical protein VTJ04DRAFT_2381 [Mycothermus thermophilus]|uniref:uncharacterized protein n=1 Tax=Humicola insolens TaxID=85995 RepID=UPI0037422781